MVYAFWNIAKFIHVVLNNVIIVCYHFMNVIDRSHLIKTIVDNNYYKLKKKNEVTTQLNHWRD